MSGTKSSGGELRVDRRSFVGQGLKAVAAIAALPALSSLLSGCGGDEQGSQPAAPTPAATPPQPAEAPPAPPQAAPAPTGEAPAAAGERPLVTEVAAMAPTVQALQYVNQSTKPDQRCASCLFFSEPAGGRGKCQLFTQGFVSEGGWCTSWSAKPAAS